MGFRKKIIILLFCLVSITIKSYCQFWDNLDDSTYNKIVSSRFNKKNILLGFGAHITIDYGDYKIVGIGLRPQVGYFLSKKWLLLGTLDLNYSYALQDSGTGNANYLKALGGPTLRYYLKSKPRSFFGQVSILAGKEMQNSENSNYAEFTGTIYMCSPAFGLSVFVRRFELELLGGIQIAYQSYYKNISLDPLLQINISYIIQK